MKKIALSIIAGFAVTTLGVAGSLFVVQGVHAQVDVFPQCSGDVDSEVCRGGDKLFGAGSIWNRILNAITYVAGAVAVLMVIIGAIRYTLSNGDQAGINNAKNTILYAIVGLVLAVMANAIINFVIINI